MAVPASYAHSSAYTLSAFVSYWSSTAPALCWMSSVPPFWVLDQPNALLFQPLMFFQSRSLSFQLRTEFRYLPSGVMSVQFQPPVSHWSL